MHALDSANFRRLLDLRLRRVSDDQNRFDELNSMIPQLYGMMSSDSAWEEFYSVSGIPDIPPFNGKLTSLSMYPGFSTKIEPAEFAAQIQAQRKLIDDKKYGVLDDYSRGLTRSANRVKEKYAVRPFANAASIAFDFMTNEEGKALASTSHLTKATGVSTASGFSNLGTSPLNKTTVAAVRLLMRKFRDPIGERYEVSDNLALIVPDALADKADEIVGTQSGLDSAEGTINVQFRRHKVIPYKRLDDYTTTSWHMVDMSRIKENLLWIPRIDNDLRREVDYSTYAYMQSIYLRFGYGWDDWRWIFSSVV